MTNMVGTIVRIIEAIAKKSTDVGIVKYKTYFVKTSKYDNYKVQVDAKLSADGFEAVIST